jgi:hypothetical protein
VKTPIPEQPDGEMKAAKLQKFLRTLVGKGAGRGFVAVLTDPDDGTVMVSSHGGSRATAEVLRKAADKLDGGKSDA